jgi:hypothetical protein
MPRPSPTYGALIDQAYGELSHALTSYGRYNGAADAVAAAQARTRLARTAGAAVRISRAELSYTHDLHTRELQACIDLETDLSQSTAAGRTVLELATPGRSSRASAHLTRAADLAGHAGDLLATRHTLGAHAANDRPSQWEPASAGRAILTDAALLARGLHALDPAIRKVLLWAAIDEATPGRAVKPLLAVAADCAVGRAADHIQIQQIAHEVPAPTWQHLKATAAPRPTWHGHLQSATDAPAALTSYLTWLNRNRPQLTLTDLTTLTSVGTRLAQLAVPDPAAQAAATAAVRAWRRASHCLRDLHTIDPRPPGHHLAHHLTRWADSQPTGPALPQAIATALAQTLPALANAGREALQQLHEAGRIFANTADAASRYSFTRAAGTRLRPALDALSEAARTSRDLAPPRALTNRQGVAQLHAALATTLRLARPPTTFRDGTQREPAAEVRPAARLPGLEQS